MTPLVYFWGKSPTPTHRLGQIQHVVASCISLATTFYALHEKVISSSFRCSSSPNCTHFVGLQFGTECALQEVRPKGRAVLLLLRVRDSNPHINFNKREKRRRRFVGSDPSPAAIKDLGEPPPSATMQSAPLSLN